MDLKRYGVNTLKNQLKAAKTKSTDEGRQYAKDIEAELKRRDVARDAASEARKNPPKPMSKEEKIAAEKKSVEGRKKFLEERDARRAKEKAAAKESKSAPQESGESNA